MTSLKLIVLREDEVLPLWYKSIMWLEDNVGDSTSLQDDLAAAGIGWRLEHHISFTGEHSLHVHIDNPMARTLATLALLPIK